ncbi:hypothetical protein, partial [Echinicola sediminis]
VPPSGGKGVAGESNNETCQMATQGWSEFAIPTLSRGYKEVKRGSDVRSSGLQIQNSSLELR